MKYLVLALVLVLATSAFGLDKKAYQIREDFGTEPLYDTALNYYYYMPCPTYSWFWAYTGWNYGDIIGTCFWIGDQGTGGWPPADPAICHQIETIRILDFAGYGTIYPLLFTVQFDMYCCMMSQNPFLHIWNSGDIETGPGWFYIDINYPTGVSICDCCVDPLPDCNPRVIVTATMVGTDCTYPAFGMDNISTALEVGCELHDYGCLPLLYPRVPCGAGDPMVHSGFVGTFPFEYWPPDAFPDGRDTTPDLSMFGAIELAWRIYIACGGPTATTPSTWSDIKSIYR